MSKRPYSDYLDSPLWKIIEQELHDLEDNGDIEITTNEDLIIGSLVQKIEEACTLCAKCKMPLGGQYVISNEGACHPGCFAGLDSRFVSTK
jgi:hypothetical protein